MTQQRLHPSLAAIDLVTAPEINEIMATRFDNHLRDMFRGVKWMRLPLALSGKATGGNLTLGISTGLTLGPESGYFWQIHRLVISGLATGTTPDVMNLYLGDNFNMTPLWQFNGNSFGYTFGRDLCIMGPETLSLQNVGALASTNLITLSGELWEVPAEMMGKLV